MFGSEAAFKANIEFIELLGIGAVYGRHQILQGFLYSHDLTESVLKQTETRCMSDESPKYKSHQKKTLVRSVPSFTHIKKSTITVHILLVSDHKSYSLDLPQ